MTDFTGWIPMRIFWRDARPLVDWGWLDLLLRLAVNFLLTQL